MLTCNRIQKLIDQADRADTLPYAASSHIAVCPACSRFADERTKLRTFLSDIPRVNAPTNFDALLKARLATSKSAGSFSWFTPVLAMRFGAVAAVALVAVFAIPYLNLSGFSEVPQTASNVVAGIYTPSPEVIRAYPRTVIEAAVPTDKENGYQVASVSSSAPSRTERRSRSTPKSVNDLANGMPVIIYNYEQETLSMPMLPVSVGAQQQMMMRASRPAPKTVGVSF